MAATETATANLNLKIAGARVHVQLTVPTAPVHRDELLPVFQTLSEAIGANAVSAAEAEGRAISCRAGCGACCRQLVPITGVEARRLRAHVAELPEPRRSAILDRFAAILRQLDEAGLLETLRRPERVPDDDLNPLGLAYFRLGLPCPFLEDESCSIHPIRPLSCREYLVTSPAENCSRPGEAAVDRVPMPVLLSRVLARFGDGDGTDGAPWIPLVLALEWAEAHPDDSAPRPGPEWVTLLLRTLTGRELPGPSGA